MDVAAGVHHPQNHITTPLPAYDDGVDLAIHVGRHYPHITWYRPHPGEQRGCLDRLNGEPVRISTAPLTVDVMTADVVVGYGSKVDF